MIFSAESKTTDNPTFSKRRERPAGLMIMIAASVLTLAATFALTSFADLDFRIKTAIFSAILLVYLCFCAVFYYLQNRRRESGLTTGSIEPAQTGAAAAASVNSDQEQESVFPADIQEKLLVLEQANSFFSSSLKTADMFRLVSNRLAEIVPFAACALFLADENKTKLKAAQAAGENAARLLHLEIDRDEQNAVGKSFTRRAAQIEENPMMMMAAAKISENLKTMIAVPLCDRNFEPYGVLAVYGDNRETAFDENAPHLLEAVSARVSPLFQSSIAFERSMENALTDSLTGLANQRAFYLVLENQLAESQRFGERRPLAVLAIDIKGFDELNRQHGHATGDKILNLTAKILKGQLRQMDFLARSSGDEFLAILPTASEEITKVIIERIEKAFRQNPFDGGGREKIHVRLNFGAASFLRDGETAQDLLKIAALKKHESKSGDNSSIIFFPREYVN